MQRPPILFFPGIMGSRLYFPNSRCYWDPDSNLRMFPWAPLWPFRSDDDNRLRLHFLEPAGVIAEAVRSEIQSLELGWGGVVWSFYGNYLRLLRDLADGGLAFAVGYDWRQDLRTLGVYAAGKIRQALELTGAPKVRLISHSMGGLVIRAALRAAPDLSTAIERILFVCQPAAGAVVLYRRLFTGMVRGFDGGKGVLDRMTRFILGNNRAGFFGNLSGLPGGVQLLPSRFFPSTDGRHWNNAIDNGFLHDALYLNESSPPGLIGANAHPDPAVRADFRDRLEECAEAHAWLGPPELPSAIEAWQLAGDGLLTDVSITFDEAGNPAPGREVMGDATVPRSSATAMQLSPDDRTILFGNLSHENACEDCRVMQWTRERLM